MVLGELLVKKALFSFHKSQVVTEINIRNMYIFFTKLLNDICQFSFTLKTNNSPNNKCFCILNRKYVNVPEFCLKSIYDV